MRTFWTALAIALSTPLLILNWTAGIVGGIWLTVIGDWGTVGYGVLIILFGMFALTFLVSPGLLIALLGVKLHERHRLLSYPFYFGAGLYNFTVMTAWCVLIFAFFISRPHVASWPYILWAYALATSAWAAMAEGEIKTDPTSNAMMWVSGVQFGSLALMISVLIGSGDQTGFGMLVFFIPAALIGMMIGAFLSKQRRLAF
jgi:hypothetical protein